MTLASVCTSVTHIRLRYESRRALRHRSCIAAPLFAALSHFLHSSVLVAAFVCAQYLVVFGEQQNRRRISRGAAPLRHEVRVRAEPHRDAPEVGRLFAGEVVRAVSAPKPIQNAEGYIEEWVLVHVPESAGANGAGSDDAETEPLHGWTALTWRELRGGKSEGQDKPCSVYVHEMLRPHST